MSYSLYLPVIYHWRKVLGHSNVLVVSAERIKVKETNHNKNNANNHLIGNNKNFGYNQSMVSKEFHKIFRYGIVFNMNATLIHVNDVTMTLLVLFL